MKTELIVDTGPLVALLNARDHAHAWAVEVARRLPAPWLTSEPVLTEAAFLVGRSSAGAPAALLQMVASGALRVPFRVEDEAGALQRLMSRYRDVPMSLADASLVRMTELSRQAAVVTLDRDFTIYRRNRNQRLRLVAPFTGP